ncbi:MAG: hypothetical protein ACO3I5_04295, partial [Pontimonas sp.]
MHSLTVAVKDELVSHQSEITSHRVAELSTILRFAGGLHVIGGNIAVEVELEPFRYREFARADPCQGGLGGGIVDDKRGPVPAEPRPDDGRHQQVEQFIPVRVRGNAHVVCPQRGQQRA